MGTVLHVDLGTPHLQLRADGRVCWLTVANPARRNALTMAMYRGIGRAMRLVEEHPELELLVVTGVDDVFITGGDIVEHDLDEDAAATLAFDLLYEARVPVIAAINGHCQGSGVWLVALADVAIASDRARFRLPELRLGVAAPWSASILPGLIGLARAKELALTSRPFGAEEAWDMGLVGRIVPHDELDQAAAAVADALLEAAPDARRAWKQQAHAAVRPVPAAAVATSITTTEAAEGFAAFAEHRPPHWSPRARVREERGVVIES